MSILCKYLGNLIQFANYLKSKYYYLYLAALIEVHLSTFSANCSFILTIFGKVVIPENDIHNNKKKKNLSPEDWALIFFYINNRCEKIIIYKNTSCPKKKNNKKKNTISYFCGQLDFTEFYVQIGTAQQQTFQRWHRRGSSSSAVICIRKVVFKIYILRQWTELTII